MTFYTKTIGTDTIQYTSLNGHFSLRVNTYYHTFILTLFGVQLFSSFLKDYHKFYSFLFFTIWRKDCSKETYCNILDTVIAQNPSYDDYYLFVSHSGEFYLLMHHLSTWLKNNNSHNFLLVLGKAYQESLLKIFFPHIPFINISKMNTNPIHHYIKEVHTTYKDKNIYTPVFHTYYLNTVEKAIYKNKDAHYYTLFKKHLQVATIDVPHYHISNKVKKKISHISQSLLKNNFLILSPESITNMPLSALFWKNLALKCKDFGFEIYTNCMEMKNLIPDTYALFLNYEEAMQLAFHAKAIIGMRSGFLECLSTQNTPLFALYTDFPERASGHMPMPSCKVLTGFSISKLPHVNQNLLYEYDVNMFNDEEELMENIIRQLQHCLSKKAQ